MVGLRLVMVIAVVQVAQIWSVVVMAVARSVRPGDLASIRGLIRSVRCGSAWRCGESALRAAMIGFV